MYESSLWLLQIVAERSVYIRIQIKNVVYKYLIIVEALCIISPLSKTSKIT